MNDLRNHDSLKANDLKSRVKRGNTLAYLQKHRGKPQYRHAPSASRAANKILRPLSRKFGPGVSSLRSHWAEIVGERWAVLSKPTAVRGTTGAKTLHIEAKGPAAAMLQADSTRILDKVNQFLGAGAIRKIAVKQGRIQVVAKKSMRSEKSIPKTLIPKGDKSLKASLDKLGQSVKSHKT
jgi:hypothetical protein